MERLSIREYGRRRNVSHEAVRRAIQTGRITLELDAATGERFIDPERADREWDTNTDPAMQQGSKAWRASKGHDGDQDAPDDEDFAPTDPRGFQAHRTRREFYHANLTQYEAEQKAGTLVAAEDVKRESFRIARAVREAILGIPERLAAELAGIPDPDKIHERLTTELSRALEAIADAV